MLVEKSDFIQNIAINSKVINDPYIKIFIRFDKDIEDEIYKFNPKLKLEEDTRGITSEMGSINSGTMNNELKTEYIATFNTLYSVEIDSKMYPTEFILGASLKSKKALKPM